MTISTGKRTNRRERSCQVACLRTKTEREIHNPSNHEEAASSAHELETQAGTTTTAATVTPGTLLARVRPDTKRPRTSSYASLAPLKGGKHEEKQSRSLPPSSPRGSDASPPPID